MGDSAIAEEAARAKMEAARERRREIAEDEEAEASRRRQVRARPPTRPPVPSISSPSLALNVCVRCPSSACARGASAGGGRG